MQVCWVQSIHEAYCMIDAPLQTDDVIERLPFPVLLTDDDGVLRICNSAALLFIGRPRHWLDEQPVGAWLDAMGATVPPRLRRSRLATVYFRDANENRRKAKVTICPLAGSGWLFTFTESHFGASDASSTLEAVAARIAERLDQVVVSVREATSMALMEEPSSEVSEALREVLSGVQMAADLQKEMLSISRQAEVRLLAASLSEVVSHAVPLIREILEPSLRLDVDLCDVPDFIQVDAGLMTQALLHLARLQMARCPKAGRCLIVVRQCNTTEGTIRLTFGTEGETASSVEESQMGDALRAAHEEAEYSIAIVRGIVEQHRGRILMDGEFGEGRRFHLEFPPARLGERIVTRPQLPRGTETVFVIEDDDSIRPVLVQALEIQGYRVMEASNGIEALAILRQHVKSIDLLVTDAILPGRSGLEIISEARALLPRLKVLLITSYSWEVLGGALPSDIPLLAKPFGMSIFTRRVRRELDTVQ